MTTANMTANMTTAPSPPLSIPYDRFTRHALRGILREALDHVARQGLKPPHHFFISFDPHHQGVSLPPKLRQSKPSKVPSGKPSEVSPELTPELTIVLQHQFRDLSVDEDGFGVELDFQGQPGKLRVPFAAVTSFYDPGAQFGLRLTALHAEQPFVEPSKSKHAPKSAARSAPSVVQLDAFRQSESSPP